MIEFSIKKKLGNFQLDVAGRLGPGPVGVFGETGSGKTTLLHCLGGLIKPDKGEIKFDGKVVYSSEKNIHLPIESRNVGIVFQDALLFPHLNVSRNIFYGMPAGKKQNDFKDILQLLNLGHLINRSTGSLSGGERQRVALARTLVREPAVLLMDEPVASVDLNSRARIISHLKQVTEQLNIPLVYVSHSVSELVFLVSQVYCLKIGRSIAYGEPLATLMDKFPSGWGDALDFENIIDCPLLHLDPENGISTLDFQGYPLKVTYLAPLIKPQLRIGIKSADILVANQKVGHISARNVIEARIDKIFNMHRDVILRTKVGDQNIFAEITSEALRELGLREGQTAYLIIKANSIKVLE